MFPFMQKRYSLQAGPPKKDPRSKGVNPAAVQALLKKQHADCKKKGKQEEIICYQLFILLYFFATLKLYKVNLIAL